MKEGGQSGRILFVAQCTSLFNKRFVLNQSCIMNKMRAKEQVPQEVNIQDFALNFTSSRFKWNRRKGLSTTISGSREQTHRPEHQRRNYSINSSIALPDRRILNCSISNKQDKALQVRTIRFIADYCHFPSKQSKVLIQFLVEQVLYFPLFYKHKFAIPFWAFFEESEIIISRFNFKKINKD